MVPKKKPEPIYPWAGIKVIGPRETPTPPRLELERGGNEKFWKSSKAAIAEECRECLDEVVEDRGFSPKQREVYETPKSAGGT